MARIDEAEFVDSLKTGLISFAYGSNGKYAPSIVSNNAEECTNVLSVVKEQLFECERFDFAVAFITSSGIEALVQVLLTLKESGVRGRILTTTFNNFNDPAALRKLLEFPNIEVRVFEGDMHTKGYFFKKEELNTILVGSANLTQAALCTNREWNVMLHSYDDGELLRAARKEYEALWNSEQAVALTSEWIDAYEAYRNGAKPEVPVKRLKPFKSYTGPERVHYAAVGIPKAEKTSPATSITPNAMQRAALEALDKLHAVDTPRALLVSATGTGKTYLSAFDVKETAPKRVLFVAHRRRILEASMRSFERVLGVDYSYSLYPDQGADADCVFAMVLSLKKHLSEFDPCEFDYIIIDEAHHGGAQTYQEILNYFKPKFLLGMTATPERTDHFDICAFYNHVIAYRITLQDALAGEMLAPFHYYGITDLTIDDEEQDEVETFRKLTSEERVKHLLEKIEDYCVNKTDRRGLVFCSRNEEAKRLARLFNERGYKSIALSGEDPEYVRNQGIEALERGEVEFIFSVDILNEGVDIPSVNLVLMLRPTESAIVFVQQLGRGLRKFPGKESVLVLDFIGNYQNNYLIPIALSGDRTFNKDNLRRFVKEGSTIIPGCSTVSFDRVAEAKIFEKIDTARFSDAKLIRSEYLHLSNMLGRVPTLQDFVEQEAIDPVLIFAKYGSYHDFLSKHEKRYKKKYSDTQLCMLRYVSKKLASGRRKEDLLVLKRLISTGFVPNDAFAGEICAGRSSGYVHRIRKSVAACLTNRFTYTASRATYSDAVFLLEGDDGLSLSKGFSLALTDQDFRNCLLETIEFGLARNERMFPNSYGDTGLCLYQKYSYEEAFRLLNWEKDANKQNVGGYQYDAATNTFPVFVNYEKDDDISETTKYEDRFVSPEEFIAISKPGVGFASPEIRLLQNHDNNGMEAYLFVRKNKNDCDGGKEFYFLGRIRPTQGYKQIVIGDTNKSAIEIAYRLDDPVRKDIYDYLRCSLD